MNIFRSIKTPIRKDLSWQQLWKAEDNGLIGCWERGRTIRDADPEISARANAGQLVVLNWKGGIDKPLKLKHKYGSFYYLAMWQGLRGEDLNLDPSINTDVECSLTGITVTFTSDINKLSVP